MNRPVIIVLLAILISGCNGSPANQCASNYDSKIMHYFELYCNYRGGLGFGAYHTNDINFRQRLKETQDAELRRLFVLQHLYRDLNLEITDFEQDIIVIGKNRNRKMTDAERESARKKILDMLNDLFLFDPNDPQHEIADFMRRMGMPQEPIDDAG